MRFICDTMLGKLSKYLRIIGLDTIYITSLADLAGCEGGSKPFYFFTKRTRTFSHENGIYIRSNDVLNQLKQIRDIIRPHVDRMTLMNRCVRCNNLLSDINKDDVENLVPEFIFHRYDRFKTCRLCKKVYWEGSHVEHMREWVEEIIR